VNPVAPAAQRDLVPDRAGPTREIERQAVEAAALAGRIAELDNEVACHLPVDLRHCQRV